MSRARLIVLLLVLALFAAACGGAAAPAIEAEAPAAEVELTSPVDGVNAGDQASAEEEMAEEPMVEEPAEEAPAETAVPGEAVFAEDETELEAEEEALAEEEPAAEAPVEESEAGAGGASDAAPTATALPTERSGGEGDSAGDVPPTALPVPDPTVAPAPIREPVLVVEPRIIEFEWPSEMRLGDTEALRLALIPSADGYVAIAESDEYVIGSEPIDIPQREGYVLDGIARLDSTVFNLAPGNAQVQPIFAQEPVTWRWTLDPQRSGNHTLTLTLTLRWTPVDGGPPIERALWSQNLDVRVRSLFGLSTQQARQVGWLSMGLAGLFSLPLLGLVWRERQATRAARLAAREPGHIPPPLPPNPALDIAMPPGRRLGEEERRLLQSLYRPYKRLAVQAEYVSGYSGARIYLASPVRSDGRPDAPAITKIGPRENIVAEYGNYERYVKHTLPPVTARISAPPVLFPDGSLGAMRYTFVGAPGQPPQSLRAVSVDEPPEVLAGHLRQLFDTFAPQWWLQQRPITFKAAQVYGRLLPVRYVVRPTRASATAALNNATTGDVVRAGAVLAEERDGDWVTLTVDGGGVPLRLRYAATDALPRAEGYEVLARDVDLLHGLARGLALPPGTVDPIGALDSQRNRVLSGMESVIHGDLNLDNVLIGPGGQVWLIDFAETREGPAVFDFVRLGVELAAHALLPRVTSDKDAALAAMLASATAPNDPQLAALWPVWSAVRSMGQRVQYSPDDPSGWQVGLYFAALGTLKFRNLDRRQKALMFALAGYLAARF